MSAVTASYHGDAVWIGDVLAGRIEPMDSKAQPWCYVPVPGADVIDALRQPIPSRTIRGVKRSIASALRRDLARRAEASQ